jgi:hypothetical protein
VPTPRRLVIVQELPEAFFQRGHMRRREFATVFGGAAVAPAMLWLLAARTQQATPIIGYLGSGRWPEIQSPNCPARGRAPAPIALRCGSWR